VIPPLEDEVALLRHYKAEVLGVALNTENLSPAAAREKARELEERLSIPVVLPLVDGVGRIVERLPL